MTTSTKTKLYGEYINPTIDQYSLEKENPLVLMAQACNNIGKELVSLPSFPIISSKQRKKSLKRSVPANCSSSSIKKIFVPQDHLNKTYSFSPTFDLSFLSTSSFYSSAFSPSFPRSSYLMDSILSSSFVCNWINSTISNGFCGKRFNNSIDLLEHLCTEHTSIKSL